MTNTTVETLKRAENVSSQQWEEAQTIFDTYNESAWNSQGAPGLFQDKYGRLFVTWASCYDYDDGYSRYYLEGVR